MKDKKETKKTNTAPELLGPAEHILEPTHDTLLTTQKTPKSE